MDALILVLGTLHVVSGPNLSVFMFILSLVESLNIFSLLLLWIILKVQSHESFLGQDSGLIRGNLEPFLI